MLSTQRSPTSSTPQPYIMEIMQQSVNLHSVFKNAFSDLKINCTFSFFSCPLMFHAYRCGREGGTRERIQFQWYSSIVTDTVLWWIEMGPVTQRITILLTSLVVIFVPEQYLMEIIHPSWQHLSFLLCRIHRENLWGERLPSKILFHVLNRSQANQHLINSISATLSNLRKFKCRTPELGIQLHLIKKPETISNELYHDQNWHQLSWVEEFTWEDKKKLRKRLEILLRKMFDMGERC